MSNAFTIPKNSTLGAELERGARKSRDSSRAVNETRKRGVDNSRIWGLSEKSDEIKMRTKDIKKLTV